MPVEVCVMRVTLGVQVGQPALAIPEASAAVMEAMVAVVGVVPEKALSGRLDRDREPVTTTAELAVALPVEEAVEEAVRESPLEDVEELVEEAVALLVEM